MNNSLIKDKASMNFDLVNFLIDVLLILLMLGHWLIYGAARF